MNLSTEYILKQKISSNVGDWIKLIEADNRELYIMMSVEEIQGVSKNVFKNDVKSKVKINFLKYLNNIKKTHTKSRNLKYTEIKLDEYLQHPSFNTTQKQLLF